MTRGNKLLALFLVQLGLLGGAAGLTVRTYNQRTVRPLEEKALACQKTNALLMARGMLIEAEVGALSGNGSFAFERIIRAQISAREAGLKLDGMFDDLIAMMLAQDPKAKQQILVLADKIAPIPVSAAPPPGVSADKAKAAAQNSPAGSALTATAPVEKSPDKTSEKPNDKTPEKPNDKPSAKAPEKTPDKTNDKVEVAPAPSPPLSASPLRSPAVEEAYRALLDAKTALIAGGADAKAINQPIARARVMLNEAGRSDLDEELDGAISAYGKKDEAQTKTRLEQALKKLR